MKRQNETAGFTFGPAIKAFLFCVFIGGSGLGFVWQKQEIGDLGRQLKDAELRLEELKRQNKNRTETLQQFLDPRLLAQKATTQFPDLTQPVPNRIVILSEPPPIARETVAPAAAPSSVPSGAPGPAATPSVRQIARTGGRIL